MNRYSSILLRKWLFGAGGALGFAALLAISAGHDFHPHSGMRPRVDHVNEVNEPWRGVALLVIPVGAIMLTLSLARRRSAGQ